MDLERYLEEKRILVDGCLEQLLPAAGEFPPVLHQAMRYCLCAGGKRIRPILAFAAAEAVGGNPDGMVQEACALELIHTFTLIHDDLPAMDNDDYRRGMPTTHKVFGEAMAILAGDALLTEAFRILACGFTRGTHRAEPMLEIIKVVAEASGSHGVVGGQVVDIESEGKIIPASRLEYIHRHKTGTLIAASVMLGGMLGGGSDRMIEHLRTYGEAVGHAFQITDDILDILGSREILGKNTGSDERRGKATYPSIMGMEEAHRKQRELYRSALDALQPFDAKADCLREIALHIIQRKN